MPALASRSATPAAPTSTTSVIDFPTATILPILTPILEGTLIPSPTPSFGW